MSRIARAGSVLLASLALVAAAPAPAPAQIALPDPRGVAVPEPDLDLVMPHRAQDRCDGRCLDILPPGTDGVQNLAELLGFQASGSTPRHARDQLAPYGDLVYAYRDLTPRRLRRFFNDHSLGVPEDRIARRYAPRADVVVIRDRARGVPHIYAATRAGAMFGAGYVAAEDRLFLMDALRHVGRGELTSFAGGAAGNRQFEQDQWRVAPYTEADLQRQIDHLDDLHGAAGRRLQRDAQAYVDGVNRYIAEQILDVTKRPGEYFAIGRPLGPEPWTLRDMVATAALVGGIFGRGGGGEVGSALVRARARQRFGARRGNAVWRALRSAEDPEAPTTVRGERFPYPRGSPSARARALPDGGRVVEQPLVTDEVALAARRRGQPGTGRPRALAPLRGMFSGGVFGRGGADALFGGGSNALVVSARESARGHPLAVFGPQTSYFAPQLLLEQEIQGPGISAKGAAFAGVSLYVLLGRGRDYAWSATSAGQDITDTFAVPLCEPDGSASTTASMHYRFRGRCLAIEVLRKRNVWVPNVADPTPPGAYTLEAQRTKLGLVTHRATVRGRPVAYTRLRSTYMHEIDSGIGFSALNDPTRVRSARDFQRTAARIGYTFNWFYVDAARVAYFNSGDNPVRADGADPDLPTWSRYEWRGFDPDRNTSRRTPFAEHPQALDQAFLTSWNNKQAPGYRAADDQYGFGSLYRVGPLDDRIRRGIAGERRMSREELVAAMEDAGTVDLRGDAVLPWALAVIRRGGMPGDARLRAALRALEAWSRSGAHRIDRDRDGTYDDARAIRIMDAWWPRWIRRQFLPVLGRPLYVAATAMLALHDPPGQRGSAFQSGWYGYAEKDLRTVLGKRVAGRHPVAYCGHGDVGRCRSVLLSSLRAALDVPATELYRRDGCPDGDQWCHDAVEHAPVGGITHPRIHWINRPTYQQVVEFPRRR